MRQRIEGEGLKVREGDQQQETESMSSHRIWDDDGIRSSYFSFTLFLPLIIIPSSLCLFIKGKQNISSPEISCPSSLMCFLSCHLSRNDKSLESEQQRHSYSQGCNKLSQGTWKDITRKAKKVRIPNERREDKHRFLWRETWQDRKSDPNEW